MEASVSEMLSCTLAQVSESQSPSLPQLVPASAPPNTQTPGPPSIRYTSVTHGMPSEYPRGSSQNANESPVPDTATAASVLR